MTCTRRRFLPAGWDSTMVSNRGTSRGANSRSKADRSYVSGSMVRTSSAFERFLSSRLEVLFVVFLVGAFLVDDFLPALSGSAFLSTGRREELCSLFLGGRLRSLDRSR